MRLPRPCWLVLLGLCLPLELVLNLDSVTLLWIGKLAEGFHLKGSPTEEAERCLRKWSPYKCSQNPFCCWSLILVLMELTLQTGLCEFVLYFLPSDWFESNNPFLNELKERRINHHFPKHTSCLLAEPVCSTTFFLPTSSWDTEPLCKVWLYCPCPLNPLNLKLR